jgi:hypothetical protein
MRPGVQMTRFVQGESRIQTNLLPECLDDYVAETKLPVHSAPPAIASVPPIVAGT